MRHFHYPEKYQNEVSMRSDGINKYIIHKYFMKLGLSRYWMPKVWILVEVSSSYTRLNSKHLGDMVYRVNEMNDVIQDLLLAICSVISNSYTKVKGLYSLCKMLLHRCLEQKDINIILVYLCVKYLSWNSRHYQVSTAHNMSHTITLTKNF